MHVGISLLDLAMGGAQTLMVQLASGLAQRGHRVSYHLSAHPNDSVHVVPSLLLEINQAAQPVRSLLDLLKCDILQLDGYHSLLRKLPYLPALKRSVETYHSLYSLHRSGPLYPRGRVAVSADVQRAAGGDTRLIYNGVPLPDLASFELPRFDLAILGRIHPVKQHLLFLQACEHLYQQRGQLSALIIGGHPQPGPYQQQVEADITRLRQAGLEIHLTGDVPASQVYPWLGQARLLLVTSENEGFGRMAVEAMACGLPVIANPVGGLLEIVQDGQTGFFAQANDPVSFADLASQLLNNPALLEAMGRKGRAAAEERFSLKVMLDAYEQLYQEIVRANDSSGRAA